jgi:hypothetical protein
LRNYTNILFLIIGCLFSQTDSTLTIYGESNLFTGDSKNPDLIWISPNGGEIYENLDLINLQWNGNDDSFTDESISIYFSQNLGYSFEAIEENISNNQNYSFNTPDINSAFSRFKITAIDFYGNQSEDLSDLYFTIGSPPTWDSDNIGGQQEFTINIDGESNLFEGDSKIPEIIWQYPNGNEEFNQGELITLGWNGSDDTFNNESISIYYSENLGSPFNIVEENISINDLVSITLLNINSAFGRFKVTAIDNYGNTNEDKSDLYFAVGNPNYQEGSGNSSSLTLNIFDESNNFIGDSQLPTIEWIYPNGGEQFDNYETITTLWNAEDESFGDDAISIYLAKELGGYYESYNSEDLPNLLSYDIQLPHADEAFARFKVTAIDSFGNSSEDFGDNYFIIGDPFGNYNVNPYDDLVILDWGWAGYHLILVDPNAISFMNFGDEIHVIDFNGIITDECNNENYGLVSVAQATYFDNATQPYTLYSIEGYENCDETETSQAGYVAGNEVGFLHYDSNLDNFYELSPNFVSWSGIFGDTPQDTLSFKFYDQSENKTYTINEEVPFTPNMIEGDAIYPFEFTYNNESYEEGSFECDFNYNDYEYNGSITSSLYNIEAGDKIACFVGNQCRGTIEAVDSPFNTTIFLLMTYGNPALSIIESFEPVTMRNQISEINKITENRDLYSFNIYRESQLIDEGLADYYYIDDDLLSDGEYCYEISLSDNEGNELIISDDQCIEVNTQNQGILGDINGDSMVNVVDVVMLVDIILNNNSDNFSADINQDGLINVTDIVLLIDLILNS